jgi:predicted MFS family arabinose efflux permease
VKVNRWVILAVLFFARTAMAFQFQSVASVSPLMVRDLALDLALFGTLVGAWMLPGVAVAIPGGLLGKRFGDKRVTLFGLLLMVLGSALTAMSSEYGVALAGRVVSGAGAVLLNVLLAKMVADWFSDRELATAMGILVVSWPVGIGLALALLGPLSAASSWSFALWIAAWMCVAALVLVGLMYRDPPAQLTSPLQAQASRLTRPELALASLAGGVWTLYNVSFIIVVSFAPLLLAGHGLPAADAALVASAATWPLIASIPLGGVVADKTGRGELIMLVCFVAMATCIPLSLVAPSPLAMLAITGLVMGPAAGVIMSLPARALRPEARNLGMGIYYTWYYVGMALLPGVAGWTRDITGIPFAPFGFAGLLMICAIVCLYAFKHLEGTEGRRGADRAASGPRHGG